MLDFNCYIGSWPFHPLAVETFEELQAIHKENGIAYGFVSSLKSMFRRDYFESEKELHETIKGTEYRHIMTVNPLFPACLDIVRYGIENWDIAGVRVLPTYHGYTLEDPFFEELCALLEEKGLPLYLTLNLEDIRNTYLLIPTLIKQDALKAFLDTHHGLTILLCGGSTYVDIIGCSEQILAHPACFFEPSGMRHGCFPLEEVGEAMRQRFVYGSMSGILCLKSSLLHMQMGELNESELAAASDGRNFLAKCPGVRV